MADGVMKNDGDVLRVIIADALSESEYVPEEFLILHQRQNATTAA
jgi:hypothetical protein